MGRPAPAGRPFLRYNELVGETAARLRTADSALALPRLGGMARPDGVVIVSERHWAFSGYDGSLREGLMPRTRFGSVPLVRGLMKLVAALSPLVRRSGVAGRRERRVLIVLLVAPVG